MPNEDWYPQNEATRRLLFQTIDEGVDDFKPKYPDVLTDAYLLEIHGFCQMYMNAYDAKEFNRAAAKAWTTWFQNLHDSEQKGEAETLRLALVYDNEANTQPASKHHAGSMEKVKAHFSKSTGQIKFLFLQFVCTQVKI